MKTYDQRMERIQLKAKKAKARRRAVIALISTVGMVAVILSLTWLLPELWQLKPIVTNPPVTQPGNTEPTFTQPPAPPMDRYDTIAEVIQKSFSDYEQLRAQAKTILGEAEDVQHGYVIGGSKYESMETEDLQEGVISADYLGQTENALFYIRGSILSVYSIAGRESEEIATFTIAPTVAPLNDSDVEMRDHYVYELLESQLLIVDNGTRAVVFSHYGFSRTDPIADISTTNDTELVRVTNLDISDVNAIREINHVWISGKFGGAKMVGDWILVEYTKYINSETLDPTDPATFVPRYGQLDAMQPVSLEDIICADQIYSSHYAVVSCLNVDTMEVVDSAAFLGNELSLHISDNGVYAADRYSRYEYPADDEMRYYTVTQLMGVSFANGRFTYDGSVEVQGMILDMHQHNGLLRFATGVTIRTAVDDLEDDTSGYYIKSIALHNSFYCLDVENWQMAGQSEAFLPADQALESVRFDGDRVYIGVRQSGSEVEPVYYFDTTDTKNLTLHPMNFCAQDLDSLIDLGNGYYLGISRYDESYGCVAHIRSMLTVYQLHGSILIKVVSKEFDGEFSIHPQNYLYYDIMNDIRLIYRDNTSGWVNLFFFYFFPGSEMVNTYQYHFEGDNLLEYIRMVEIDGWYYVFGESQGEYMSGFMVY